MSKPPQTPQYTIDHEGMQRVSALGVIDPNTGMRSYWCPDAAVDFLNQLQAKPGFDRDRYCSVCESYDYELGIRPWQKKLPKARRQIIAEVVALPWQGKPSSEIKLRLHQKERIGMPTELDSCHMCLLSFLDDQEIPELSEEQAMELKAEFRAARDEWARLKRAQSNPDNSFSLSGYIEQRLRQSAVRLNRATQACKDAGFNPSRRRTLRDGDYPAEVEGRRVFPNG